MLFFQRRSLERHPARHRGSVNYLIPPVLLVLLLLAVSGLVSFRVIQSFTDHNRQVMQSHRILAELAITRSDLQDAELEQRGYLLTGDRKMERNSRTAANAAVSDLLVLRHLTTDSPVQQRTLDALIPAVSVWQSDLAHNARSEIAQEPVRKMTDGMAEQEFRELMWHSPAAEQAGKTAQRLVLAGVGLIAALLLLAGVMGRQYHQERTRTEAVLRSAQANLELRVHERTKEMEEAVHALQEREHRFRSLADSMPQIIWTTRPDGVNDFYNQRWHDYTGLSLGETEDGGIPAVVHAEDLSIITAGWNAAWESGRSYTMEYRLLRRDGEYRWHLGRVVPLRDQSGEIILWVGTGTDIDDYKKVAAALNESHLELEARVLERTAELEIARDRVLESEAQFRAAIEAMQEGVLVQDRDKVVLLCNAMAEEILGVAPGTLAGTSALRLGWHLISENGDDYPPAFFPSHLALITGQPQATTIMGLRWLSGDVTWLSVSAAPLYHVGEATPYAAVTTFSDITDRRRAEEALRQAEEQYHSIFENSAEGIFQSTLDGRFLQVNPSTARMLGYPSPDAVLAEITHIPTQLYYDAADRDRLLGLLASGATVNGFDTAFRRRDGSCLWISMNARLHLNVQGEAEYLEGSVQDITERRAEEQRMTDYNIVLEFQKQELEKTNVELARVNAQLETLATLDGLTGLKNHRAFQERLEGECTRARRYNLPLSVIMLDVDKFKDYNDVYGHPAGDEVLCRVANILQDAVRDCDFVARYGGEEFVLILPQTESEGAFVIAERCRAAIERFAWPLRSVTASFGLASLSPGMTENAALLSAADSLLYVAKANGRNQVARSHVASTEEARQDTRLELQMSI